MPSSVYLPVKASLKEYLGQQEIQHDQLLNIYKLINGTS
jgi:hypothetical protein